ncbi:hypothetical protein LR48_Vigan05g092500 [Vigna angularis]|uniref:(S)-2-hydroxy-acid oxidase n=1 Tax=Phaseolus angularis TaxID=3914 RepID=A0A0L9UKV2_PHAAN|nr:hypothetical protein LR48_Vigan05g092500 [Vigna angularis]
MEMITNVTEYEAIAKEKLPKMVYDYYASGAEDQWTLKENRNAFARILFRPRILVDVSRIDLTATILGFKVSMPIMIAPTAMQKMAHPEGEFATARAASAAGTIMTLSSWATSSVEEVASTGPGIRFFQLYVFKDRNVVAQLVRRAERAGFKAIALTVDTPILGRREADIKNRFTLPPHLILKNFEGLDLGKLDKTKDSGLASYVAGQIDRSLNWKDISWLQTITSLPILVKGVLTAEDTRLALKAGAAGIIVSNHGARQLDYVPATISALEEALTSFNYSRLPSRRYVSSSIRHRTVEDGERPGRTVEGGERSGRTGDNGERVGRTVEGRERSGRKVDNGERSGRKVDNGERSGRKVDNGERSGRKVDNGERAGRTVNNGERPGRKGGSRERQAAMRLVREVMLPSKKEVVKAAEGRIPVFLDGGVRRGTDVFKALALGAAGVFIGRPVLFSLAADGEAGVRKVLQMLRDEFELTMALTGCRSLKEISRDHVITEWDRPRISPKL